VIRPIPKPVKRPKVAPRFRRPHRFEEARDDPAPAPNCWECRKPRDHKIHRLPGARRIGRKVAGPRPSDVLPFPKPRREKKTKHGRRPREHEFMAFCHARGCEMKRDTELQRVLGISHRRCRGRLEFAHLSDLKRYDVGDVGACLCEEIHEAIDGETGGKGWWYAPLDWTAQHTVRMRLANGARRAWDALTQAERDAWEERAAAEKAAARAHRVISEA
jgi:hypothetical protein